MYALYEYNLDGRSTRSKDEHESMKLVRDESSISEGVAKNVLKITPDKVETLFGLGLELLSCCIADVLATNVNSWQNARPLRNPS